MLVFKKKMEHLSQFNRAENDLNCLRFVLIGSVLRLETGDTNLYQYSRKQPEMYAVWTKFAIVTIISTIFSEVSPENFDYAGQSTAQRSQESILHISARIIRSDWAESWEKNKQNQESHN